MDSVVSRHFWGGTEHNAVSKGENRHHTSGDFTQMLDRRRRNTTNRQQRHPANNDPLQLYGDRQDQVQPRHLKLPTLPHY
jgi:hypothetical protein